MRAEVLQYYGLDKPLLVQYRDYMLNLRELGFAECRHIVYDHLVAPTAFYLRRNDVKKWFDVAGLARQSITWVNRNSWSGTACRPALP